MDGVRIRVFHAADAQVVEAMFDRFQDQLTLLDPLRRTRRAPGFGASCLARTLQALASHEGLFLVAEVADAVIGFVVGTINSTTSEQELEVIPTTTGRVTELFIDQDYRNRRVGSALMDAVESWFAECACHVIRIEVFEPNHGAAAFYATRGYGVRNIEMLKVL